MAKKKTVSKVIPKRADRDQRVRQSERIARVLRVLYLIQSRGQWNVKSIARELGCSDRTVHRDLKVLEFYGIPFQYSAEEQSYRVGSGFRFPTLMLTHEEVLGQAVATRLTSATGLDVGLGAAPTTTKLASASNGDTQQLIANAMSLVEVVDLKFADHSRHGKILNVIQHALLSSNQLTGMYESPYEDGPVKVTIHPYRLCLVKQAWYVIGKINGESNPKTFRVARFKSLLQTTAVADRPERFDLRQYFGNAWSVYRGEKSYDIELHFDAIAARTVLETNWHHTQKTSKHHDGSVTLKFTVDGLEEIQSWILGWSGHVTIVAPDELRLSVAEKLAKAVRMNPKKTPSR